MIARCVRVRDFCGAAVKLQLNMKTNKMQMENSGEKNRWTSFSRHFVVTLFNFNALSQQNLWLFTCSIIARRISHRTSSRWSCFRLSFTTKDSFPTRTRKEILHFCKLSSKIFHFISFITTPRKCFICPHFPSLRLHLFVIKTQGGKER